MKINNNFFHRKKYDDFIYNIITLNTHKKSLIKP